MTKPFILNSIMLGYNSYQFKIYRYQTTSIQYVKKNYIHVKKPERNGRLEITPSFIYP